MDGLAEGVPLFFKGNPPPLPPIQGKPFLTGSRKRAVHLGPLQRRCIPSTSEVRLVRPVAIQGVSPPQGQLAQRLCCKGPGALITSPTCPRKQAAPLNSGEQTDHTWPSENGESVTLSRLLEWKQQNPSGSCYWFRSHRHALCSVRPGSPPHPDLCLDGAPSAAKGATSSSWDLLRPLIHPLPLECLFRELTPRPSHVHREPNGIT